MSFTPHRLIREAEAVLVTQSTDVLELVGALGRGAARPASPHRRTDELRPDELRVFEAVPARGARSASELSLASGVGLAACLAILDGLVDRGFLVQDDQWDWRLPPRVRTSPQLPFDS